MHGNKKLKLCGTCFVVHPSGSGRQDIPTTVSVDWQYSGMQINVITKTEHKYIPKL